MSTTSNRSRIVLSLPSNLSDRHDNMMSLLASGWVQITYRKGDGTTVCRLATRNTTIVECYDCRISVVAIRNSDSDYDGTGIVYYDHLKGGIRSFYPADLIEVAIPLAVINEHSAKQKTMGAAPHPQNLHRWWARRPLAAARAVLFAQLVDDPSAHEL